jgi:hypothetical protein
VRKTFQLTEIEQAFAATRAGAVRKIDLDGTRH